MHAPSARRSGESEQVAFRMFLRPGCAADYRARHDAIWPELVTLLRGAGIYDYSIFVDPWHGELFAVLRREAGHTMESLANEPVMRRWWAYMSDLMLTHADGSPITEPLSCAFHLD